MSHKYWGWCIAFISMSIAILVGADNYNQSKEIQYQNQKITFWKEKYKDLEEKQKNIDWLEDQLEAIDNYISVVDQLKLKGNNKFPDLERTAEELNEARFEVVKNAVYWDRELNKREE